MRRVIGTITIGAAVMTAGTAMAELPPRAVDAKPVVSYNPPPAPPSPTIRHPAPARPVIPVLATLTHGSTTLYNATLNIGGAGTTNVSIREPMLDSRACPPGHRYASASRRQIEINIAPSGTYSQGNSYNLTVRYARPPEQEPCGGSLSISISQVFEWDGRGTKTFTGDGGLKLVLKGR